MIKYFLSIIFILISNSIAFSEDDKLIPIKINGKVFYMSKKGIIQDIKLEEEKKKERDILNKFYLSESFSDGLARVKSSENSKWGFIDKSSNFVISPKFYFVWSFSEGLAGVKIEKNSKYGFINKSGELNIPAKFDEVGSFSEGLASVQIGNKYGFINKSGELNIPAKFDEVGSFSEGFSNIKIGNKYGFINKSGKLTIPAKFDYALAFSEGLASVQIGNKYGFINKSGKLTIPAKFDYASAFSESFAGVQIGNKYGFIDKLGNFIIKPHFDKILSFQNGFSYVKFNGEYVYIDKKGTIIWSKEKYNAEILKYNQNQNNNTEDDWLYNIRTGDCVSSRGYRHDFITATNVDFTGKALSILDSSVKVRIIDVADKSKYYKENSYDFVKDELFRIPCDIANNTEKTMKFLKNKGFKTKSIFK